MGDIKILLVDDEDEFVSTISELLDLRDLKSFSASSGDEALQLVRNSVPDIIVMDLRMHGLDGMEVLRRVKRSCPTIQVIILTGHGNDLEEAEARRLGAFDYLRKPVDIELLADRIRAAYREMARESSMPAVAFAEAGEFDLARKLLK